jgi:hypothetical protein
VGTFEARLSLATCYNYGLAILSSPEEWGKLGPLAQISPMDIRNIGATEREKTQQGPRGISRVI